MTDIQSVASTTGLSRFVKRPVFIVVLVLRISSAN